MKLDIMVSEVNHQKKDECQIFLIICAIYINKGQSIYIYMYIYTGQHKKRHHTGDIKNIPRI